MNRVTSFSRSCQMSSGTETMFFDQMRHPKFGTGLLSDKQFERLVFRHWRKSIAPCMIAKNGEMVG